MMVEVKNGRKAERPMLMSALLAVSALILTGCGGSGGSTGTTTPPPPPPPVKLTPYVNPQVSCGAYEMELPGVLPWKLTRPSTWVVMGSSSAWGAGASNDSKSWVGLLRKSDIAANASIQNIAMGGHSTYNALGAQCVVSSSRPKFSAAHNVDQALSLKPDLVILSYPSNDAAGSLPAVESAANLLLLRWQLAQKNSAVLVLSSQPRNMEPAKQALLLELDKLLKPVLGPCLVELHALLADSAGNLAQQYNAGDGVHLNDAGHAVIHDAVVDRLRSRQCVDVL